MTPPVERKMTKAQEKRNNAKLRQDAFDLCKALQTTPPDKWWHMVEVRLGRTFKRGFNAGRAALTKPEQEIEEC